MLELTRRGFMLSCATLASIPFLNFGGKLGGGTVYYWNLHSPPEGLSKAVQILNDLEANFIWYAHWMVGYPMPPDLNEAKEIALRCGLNEKEAEFFQNWCKKQYYTLNFVREQTDAVKGKTYCPAILGYTNFRVDFNFDPITFEPITREEIREDYLLNFGKWGIINPSTGKPYTVEETQELFYREGLPKHNGIPDYSNPKVIDYYINRAKAFKMVGANAIWYDLLFQLPLNLTKMLHLSYDHPMIRDLYNGCCKIVEGAKSLGLMVGTWYLCLSFPYDKTPNVDFVTASPMVDEILHMRLDYKRWSAIAKAVDSVGKKLLIIFDFGDRDNLPLPVFSQKLSPSQQSRFLVELHDLAEKLDCSVAYPVHGPGLGAHPHKLAWGKYKIYDARAPEFRTYPTIKRLMTGEKVRNVPWPKSWIGVGVLVATAILRSRKSSTRK